MKKANLLQLAVFPTPFNKEKGGQKYKINQCRTTVDHNKVKKHNYLNWLSAP
jgi:hypothetical protein